MSVDAAPLPPGYELRRPRQGDEPAIAAATAAAENAMLGTVLTTADHIAAEWQRPRFDPDLDAWLVETAGRVCVAYASVWDPNPATDYEARLSVHPSHAACGVGDALLSAAEARVAQHAPPRSVERLTLSVACYEQEEERRRLLLGRGYRVVREYLDLGYELRRPVPAPQLPGGIELRPIRLGTDDRAAFEAADDAFAEHFHVEVETYEEWRQRMFAQRYLDPAFWFLAWDRSTVVGDVIAYPFGGRAYIWEVAVRRPWRGRGIGLALLLHELRALKAAGLQHAWLTVDAANHTGALTVYARAHMRLLRSAHVFELTLRPG